MLALHAQMRKRRCLVTFSVGTSGRGSGVKAVSVVALANLRLGGQSLPKLSSHEGSRERMQHVTVQLLIVGSRETVLKCIAAMGH